MSLTNRRYRLCKIAIDVGIAKVSLMQLYPSLGSCARRTVVGSHSSERPEVLKRHVLAELFEHIFKLGL